MKLLGRVILFFLLLSFVGIQLFKHNESWRTFYNLYIQRGISLIQRFLFGTISFSVGEIFIIVFMLLIIFLIILLCDSIIKYKFLTLAKGINLGIWILNLGLATYVFYMILWGLNYNRPIPKYFNEQNYTTTLKYDEDDLDSLSETLLSQVTYSYDQISDHEVLPSLEKLYSKAFMPYKRYLIYQSIKPSIFSTLLSYSGVSGYYNFISGEAIINKNYPRFLTPFVLCHEIAHQKGIASEGLANFEGFLHAIRTKDPVFVYSASITALFYTLRYMRTNDSSDKVKAIMDQFPEGVKEDIAQYGSYIKKYKGKIDKLTSFIYDKFLKSNKQVNGIKSYDEFVSLLIQWNQHR